MDADREQDLCTACYQRLPVPQNPCPRCAIEQVSALNNVLCGQCLQNKDTTIHTTYSALLYEMPITQFLLDLKFKGALQHANLLGQLLLEKIETVWYRQKALPQWIIPVPLHPERLCLRGYNQALEIARPIAKKLHLPLLIKGCKRLKATQPQTLLLAEDRKRNIQDAFSVCTSFNLQHVAVIDDVMTTGHTIMEFCRTLKKAGVGQIDVWCAARPHKPAL